MSNTIIPEPVMILGVPVHPLTYDQFLDVAGDFVREAQPRQICTANPEFVMTARRTPQFLEVLQKADLVLPDGVGLLWAAERLGRPLPQRVTGSDGIYHLCERAAREGWRLFLLGAGPGIADATATILSGRYPRLQIAGTYAGSPAEDELDMITKLIHRARPDILLVAYGAPKQDLWINRHKVALGVPVSIGVGGAFDHVSGVRRRAPTWLIRLNLEWLWRLLTQPWRWRRQLDLPRFVWTVLREAEGSKSE
ncbi:MAG: WecB/TagA/CpsF family glycosyltransferase [Chloroflexi bacterium]|nr:WecB/TagA/CpsF family glycosyltransferase [Chloroflexota bacterium]